MLLLTSTSDKLQVVTGSAGTIDVHASFMDNVSGAVAPGRANTNITAAVTTDVVTCPASTQRNIKTLHVRNRGGSSNIVTVQHTDGTTLAQLHRTTLLPDQTLQYIDEIGFIVASGAAQSGAFPATTAMLFQQSSSPTGWTKQTTHNDKALRVTSGGAASGGVLSFSTAFARINSDPFTLDASTMPAHSHLLHGPWGGPPGGTDGALAITYDIGGAGSHPPGSGGHDYNIIDRTSVFGGGGSHAHGMDIRVQYVDVIIATKD